MLVQSIPLVSGEGLVKLPDDLMILMYLSVNVHFLFILIFHADYFNF